MRSRRRRASTGATPDEEMATMTGERSTMDGTWNDDSSGSSTCLLYTSPWGGPAAGRLFWRKVRPVRSDGGGFSNKKPPAVSWFSLGWLAPPPLLHPARPIRRELRAPGVEAALGDGLAHFLHDGQVEVQVMQRVQALSLIHI